MKLDRGVLQSLPKVLLHEHLDGVLQPQTVIELAKDGDTCTFRQPIPRRWRNGFIKARTREVSLNTSRVSATPSRSCKRRRLWSASPMNRPTISAKMEWFTLRL